MPETLEVCIVSGSYQAHGDATVVELWCRARDGRSVLLLVRGLVPHVEIAEPGVGGGGNGLEARLAAVRDMPDVVRVHAPVDKWTDLGVKPHWRVDVRQPFVVPKLREKLAVSWAVSSADILFVQRLLLDGDLGPHISARVEALPMDGDAIRAAGGRGLYPVDMVATASVEDLATVEPFAAPLVTLSFDLETSITHGTILCAAAVVQRGDVFATHTFDGAEEEILEGMTRLVREADPDIITGYNIDNFDLPKVAERSKALAGRDAMRRAALAGWGRVPALEDAATGRRPALFADRGQSRTWSMTGRAVMDAWWQARMTLRPKRESLKFVSELLFPEREDLRKMDVDASQMDREWAERPDVVLEYCARDALLPIEILDAISATARKEALAAVAKVPLETAIAGTTSQWLDSLTIRLADREGVAVPMTRRGGRSDAITGGYVHEVEAGVHPWVAVLDFKSMYPSIMIQHNICHTTRVDAARGDVPEDASHIHEAPTGTRFVTREVREGLVPRLLQTLMARRDAHKAEMKAASDEVERAFHDQMQFAVKILMNSFYGVFASAFYRFTHPDIGSAITGWARANIKGGIRSIEEGGNQVVYSDTDSVFCAAPVPEDAPRRDPRNVTARGALETRSAAELSAWDSAVATLNEFGQTLAVRYSVEGAELEYEKGLAVFFSHGAKKRYVGRVVYPESELLIRGYEVRRTDSFELLNRTMMDTFEKILDGDHAAAVQDIIAVIRRIKAGEVDPADLVISRGCKGKLRKDGSVDFAAVYDNPDGLPYVQAARKRIDRGLSFTPGMKVGYIITDARHRPLTVEPWLVDEIGEAPPKPDADFYADRLARAMGRITEAFGWSRDDLLKGNRQATLFSF